MRVELPYGRERLTVDLPDTAAIALPADVAPVADPVSAVRDALERPAAGPSLRQRLRGDERVVIVVSDVTRPVPNPILLPPVFEVLHAAGIPDERITILNGTGLHRENTDAELVTMLGDDIAHGYRIVQHDARDRSTLVEVGRSRGVRAELARAYVEADLRIVTGFVEPHLFAGFSGGAKGVMPGVAGGDIVMSNHGAPQLASPRARWLVAHGNPVFDEMQEVCAMCPPHFLLNVTLSADKQITGVFSGDWQAAHAAARQTAASHYAAPIAALYDVVVVTNMGYPADLNLYQSVKGMSVAAEGVREGGAIVLVAGCEDGIGSDDYAGMLATHDSPAALLEAILHNERPRHDQWQVQCQAMVQLKADVYVHSMLWDEEVRAAHLTPIADVSATVTMLVERARSEGRPGSVLVLPYGQLTVPVLS